MKVHLLAAVMSLTLTACGAPLLAELAVAAASAANPAKAETVCQKAQRVREGIEKARKVADASERAIITACPLAE